MVQGAQTQVVMQASGRCLNCGEELHGVFCAACGQRSVPANPTVAEVAGDAWQELSGYDGRLATTFRNLLRPGRLTVEYLQGRRARYLSPVRLYLVASVVYFLAAAAVPPNAGGLRIGVWNDQGSVEVSAEDRAALAARLADEAWPLRVLLQSALNDPAAFRARVFTIMPRVFFAMLPVFAGIVWLFYRRMKFPATLVYAVHLHTFAFLSFAIAEAAKLTRSLTIAVPVGLMVVASVAVYALLAQRAVFGGGWPMTFAKATGIAMFYVISAVPAFAIILFWAALV
jgi:hypothetical protein